MPYLMSLTVYVLVRVTTNVYNVLSFCKRAVIILYRQFDEDVVLLFDTEMALHYRCTV